MKRAESLCKEIMAEHALNMGRDLDIQVHEAYRISESFKPKRSALKHYNKAI